MSVQVTEEEINTAIATLNSPAAKKPAAKTEAAAPEAEIRMNPAGRVRCRPMSGSFSSAAAKRCASLSALAIKACHSASESDKFWDFVGFLEIYIQSEFALQFSKRWMLITQIAKFIRVSIELGFIT